MYDKELVQEILSQILISTETILNRFEPIKTVNDFTKSPEGMEKLDAICMQLITIGESLKNIDTSVVCLQLDVLKQKILLNIYL